MNSCEKKQSYEYMWWLVYKNGEQKTQDSYIPVLEKEGASLSRKEKGNECVSLEEKVPSYEWPTDNDAFLSLCTVGVTLKSLLVSYIVYKF